MSFHSRKSLLVSALMSLFLFTLNFTGCTQQTSVTLNISAAASLTDAIKAVDKAYTEKKGNITITENLASSGTLQTQIENGAPTDVFLSAATKQMDALQSKELIIEDSRINLLNNKVVVIVPADSILTLTSFKDLTSASIKQIAIGDPKFVPAGTYAQQAFDFLNITTELQPKLILGSDVRQVLNYVESGNVDAGVVYATDAKISPKVKILTDAPDEINSKIVYPAAVIKASKNAAAAREYIEFLLTDEAAAIFDSYGFSVIKK